MSLSTTTTATYELVKYSRAYNHSTPTTPSEQAELQWQHFVNPVIKLTMDTRKDTTGHLESYRLRIVWTFSADPHAMDVDQREVVFEDLDLVTYSAMPNLQASMHGIPLKAVYQDAVVGLRYQHPRVAPTGATPTNTRPRATQPSASSTLATPALQATSQSMLRSSQSTVHMAVDDPAPAAPIRRTQTSLPPFSTLVSSSSAGWEPHTASQGQGVYSNQALSSLTSSRNSAAGHWMHSDRANTTEVGSEVTLGRQEGAYSSSSRPSSAVSVSSAAAAHASSSGSHRSSDVYAPVISHDSTAAALDLPYAPALGSAATATRDTAATGLPVQIKPQLDKTSSRSAASSDVSDLPSSSFPHASSSPPRSGSGRLRQSSPELMPPPPVPPSAVSTAIPGELSGSTREEIAGGDATTIAPAPPSLDVTSTMASGSQKDSTGEKIMTTLSMQEGTSVYGLPKAELEALVAEVIREDGFAELMAALDGMWRVKGLIGIS
ncbi:hypothetical protein ONZ51_g10389 [Trametes cubensis]|uniref:Autophagy-related protein 13 n=1 Tax=Trametes cubensis TaxID=1111947 RepID=A0AAD7TJW0_9APHY|nr:hypothetical protein ONZ51_g10389 [Trametes cubensis]